MTKKLLLGLAIFGILLLNLAATSSFAWDCMENLVGYSWNCTLKNEANQSLNFKLAFENDQIVSSSYNNSAGVFACQMEKRLFRRELVSGRSFVATLRQVGSLALTGTSYSWWILNGNGVDSNKSAFTYKCSSPTPLFFH